MPLGGFSSVGIGNMTLIFPLTFIIFGKHELKNLFSKLYGIFPKVLSVYISTKASRKLIFFNEMVKITLKVHVQNGGEGAKKWKS